MIYARGLREVDWGGSTPRALTGSLEQSLGDALRLRESYAAGSDGAVHVWLAPTSLWGGMTRDGLDRVRQFADRHAIPITMHLLEIEDDNEVAWREYGRGVVLLLEEIGFLGPDLLAVHCVRLKEAEVEVLARHGVRVAHNPVSNAYLGVGILKLRRLLQAGVVVGLGTDGADTNNNLDMLQAIKFAALLQLAAECNPGELTASEALKLAGPGSAKAIGLEDELGTLEVGKRADFVLLDPIHPSVGPCHDPIASIAFSAGPAAVRAVAVGGQFMLKEGEATQLDRVETMEHAQRRAERLAARAGLQRTTDRCIKS